MHRAPAVQAIARPFGFVRGAIVAGLFTASAVFTGCGEADHQADPGGPDIDVPRQASAWRTVDDSTVLALAADDPVSQSVTAMSADELARARDRFLADEGSDDDDATWFVLWGAESSGGGRELLWLQVARWTEFRVEGFVASAPIDAADSSLAVGIFRGITPDDVIDWMRTTTDGTQGGQVIGLLEREHGRASDALPGMHAGESDRGSAPDDPPDAPPPGDP